MLSHDHIRKLAAHAGFAVCGVARARVLEERADGLTGWLREGHQGGLGYMEREPLRRIDPSVLLPGAQSLIVCAMRYENRSALTREAWEQAGVPRVASFAQMPEDYHVAIKEKLRGMLAALQADVPELEGKCFVDTAPLLEKAWAVEAGLGWIGRNSLLVVPRIGSFVLLGEILLSHEVDRYDAPFAKEHCGRCRRCVEACPSGAILEGRTIDAGKCISRRTFERRRLEPDAPTEVFPGGWIYGCDACQEACPYND